MRSFSQFVPSHFEALYNLVSAECIKVHVNLLTLLLFLLFLNGFEQKKKPPLKQQDALALKTVPSSLLTPVMGKTE